MSTRSLEQGPAGLQPVLAELEALGVDGFDPVRFRYIKAMARRSAELDGTVADIVANKAVLALQDYHSALSQARAEAESLLEQFGHTRPDLVEQARALFTAFEFRALERLAGRQQGPARGALSALLDRLDGNDRPAGTPAIEALLRQQEADAVRTASADPVAAPAGSPGELRSA
mgnify:FL=1